MSTLPRGADIFRSNGNCRKCSAPSNMHRKYQCRRMRPVGKLSEGGMICDGECLYRLHNDGTASLCSVCPECLNTPAGMDIIIRLDGRKVKRRRR